MNSVKAGLLCALLVFLIPFGPAAAQVEDPEVLFEAGKESFSSGDYENALRLLKQSTRIDPYNADVHHKLAHTYKELDRYDEALESFDRAIALESDVSRHRTCKASLCVSLGRYEDAIEEYLAMDELQPDDPWIQHNLGHAHEGLGDYGKALDCLARAREFDPDEQRHRRCYKKIKYLKEKKEKPADKSEPEKKDISAGSQDGKQMGKSGKQPPGIPVKKQLDGINRWLEKNPLLRLIIIVGSFIIIAGFTTFILRIRR